MVGLGAVAYAAQQRASVISIDLDDSKLALAPRAGANHVINSRTCSVHDALLAVTGGLGPDVIIEAVGTPATYRLAIEEVAHTGRVVFVGWTKEPVSFETKHFVHKELDIIGSRNSLTEFTPVIHMLAGKVAFPVNETISVTVPLAEAGNALLKWSQEPESFTKFWWRSRKALKYRELGKTGLRVSVLGFGASPLGNVFDDVPASQAERAVHAAIDRGINFFDVSPYYGATLAEHRLGAALEGRRKEVVLSTKCGRYGADTFDFSAARVAAGAAESLRRLRTDYVDLLMAHDIEFADRNQILERPSRPYGAFRPPEWHASLALRACLYTCLPMSPSAAVLMLYCPIAATICSLAIWIESLFRWPPSATSV